MTGDDRRDHASAIGTASRFGGTIVVITGAAQGIGKAAALRIASEAGSVVIVDRAREAGQAAAQEIRGLGYDVDFVYADLGTSAGAHAAIDTTLQRRGRIDVLVNNVGGTIHIKPFWEYAAEEIEAEVERSFWPTIWTTHAVLPHMVERGSGVIVNVGTNAVRGTLRVPYAASKGGVMGFTTSLSLELAERGIRVNCVAPGGTVVPDRPTPRNPAGNQVAAEAPYRIELESFLMSQIPMRRRGFMEEQAAAIAFMASDDASFITGQILSVAGGSTVP
jgi:dihydroxycyclohexadiene carboxylate dehydrogenase